MKRYYAAALAALMLLTSCGTAQAPAADSTQKRYQIPQNNVDLTYFRTPVQTEPAEEETGLTAAYDTEILSADGVVLAELKKGEWTQTENGKLLEALLKTVTPDAVVGPEIQNVLRLDTRYVTAAQQILAEANIEGSVIVTDPEGQVLLAANNPPDQDYLSEANFNGSTGKIFVSTAMLEYGVEEQYLDEGFFKAGGHNFYNYDAGGAPYASPVLRDLLNAFMVSSNAYFMHAAHDLLSSKKMIEAYNKYYGYNVFGDEVTGYYFPADWMNIPQPNWDTIKTDAFERAKSAIGLSDKVKITPLFLNAVTGAIASGGLHQLNLWQASVPRLLTETEPLPDSIRERLWGMMDSCAQWTNSTALAPLDGYKFYVKTGTGDTRYGQNSEFYLKRLLLTGFLAKDNEPKMVITMYCHNGAENQIGSGGGMAPYYRRIAEMLLKEPPAPAEPAETAPGAAE